MWSYREICKEIDGGIAEASLKEILLEFLEQVSVILFNWLTKKINVQGVSRKLP